MWSPIAIDQITPKFVKSKVNCAVYRISGKSVWPLLYHVMPFGKFIFCLSFCHCDWPIVIRIHKESALLFSLCVCIFVFRRFKRFEFLPSSFLTQCTLYAFSSLSFAASECLPFLFEPNWNSSSCWGPWCRSEGNEDEIYSGTQCVCFVSDDMTRCLSITPYPLGAVWNTHSYPRSPRSDEVQGVVLVDFNVHRLSPSESANV